MGMGLSPRNKEAGKFHWGAFGWSWMLEEGVGLPVGHFKGLMPGSFIYLGRPDGKCLGYNAGAKVSAKEAKQMAQIARWVVQKQRAMREQYENMASRDREAADNDRHRLFNLPVRSDLVDRLADFADWADKSGGFRVY